MKIVDIFGTTFPKAESMGALATFTTLFYLRYGHRRKDTWPNTRIKGVLHLLISNPYHNQNALTATDVFWLLRSILVKQTVSFITRKIVESNQNC